MTNCCGPPPTCRSKRGYGSALRVGRGTPGGAAPGQGLRRRGGSRRAGFGESINTLTYFLNWGECAGKGRVRSSKRVKDEQDPHFGRSAAEFLVLIRKCA